MNTNQIFLKLGLESRIKKGLSRRGVQAGVASQYNKGIASQHSTFQPRRNRISTFQSSKILTQHLDRYEDSGQENKDP